MLNRDSNINKKGFYFAGYRTRFMRNNREFGSQKLWPNRFVRGGRIFTKVSWKKYTWDHSELVTKKRLLGFFEKQRAKALFSNTKKANISTLKLNVVFKKVIKSLFKLKSKSGNFLVKFLQPVNNILSMRKLRYMASKTSVLRRYKKQKIYRRMLWPILLFFRYWNPQVIVEQIAFELEQTKKHWPVIKTIRAMLLNLNNNCFHGFRFLVKGKINSSDRTRGFFIKHGENIPINTFNTRILYAKWHSKARTVTFGIRGWIYVHPHVFNKK